MSDKKSASFSNTNAPVMGIQFFPSIGQDVYIRKYDAKVRAMLDAANFHQGPVWIEAFYDGIDNFIFNEMGYRFGGSLTYYPVKYFNNVNQLDLLIESALKGACTVPKNCKNNSIIKKYCILPVHIRPGTICNVEGEIDIQNIEDLYAYVPVHFCGDKIEAWGSAQQVFCYLHFTYDDVRELKSIIHKTLSILRACDGAGENLLYTLFDINNL